MTRREKLAESLMRPMNPSFIVILGVYTIVWGLWILSPFWTVFSQAPLYAALAHIAAEWVWGAIAVVAGVIISYGAYKPSYFNLTLGSFTAALHWLVIALMYFVGDWSSTGGITSLAFAIYASIVWLNIKTNKKEYQSKPL